jgi:hypothetical protein
MNEIITQLISATAIISLLGYLGQKALDVILNSKIENFKQRIEHENEVYKSKLNMLAKEHEVKFEALHVERAKAIKEMYILLTDFTDYVRGFVQLFRTKNQFNEDFRQGAAQTYFKLLQFYKYNKLYFSEEFCIQYSKFEEEGGIINNSIMALNLNS